MKDRTDLEDDISRFWAVKDHIKLLAEQYIDSPKIMTEDEVWNQLAAIEAMLELYIDKAMDTYCQVFQLNEYATEEQKAYRAAWLAEFSGHLKKSREAAEKATKKVKKK
jgi:hypothetical protein